MTPSETLQQQIARLVEGTDLSREDATGVMQAVMSGDASDSLISAFLVALRMKGETIDEITGFAGVMRDKATRIETSRRPLVDTCGTGGDRSGTFNVSTTTAFVVAGAGVAVAKHGNRSASSQCGSADVLEELGVNINATPDVVGRCIDDVGIGFLFARSLHGAMKHVAAARQELKIRTVFNVLGPLTNPANATGQVMGVFDNTLVEPLAHVLQNLGVKHAFVVGGLDGLDEVTLGGPSVVAESKGNEVTTYEVSPSDFGISFATYDEVTGGDPKTNAAILRGVLDGKEGPHRDIVLVNAAPAILAGEGAATWEEGIAKAREAIDSGGARGKLDALIEASK